MRCLLLGCSLLLAVTASAQTSAEALLAPYTWRNIGPANMMGRISALDGYDPDPDVLLIGAASGGVFKTINGGVTVTPIFDDYGSQSIGDVAFSQADTSVIWVGTGEATNRNSVGWGDGVYRSTNGGVTFEHVGLRDTYQISEISPHPTDPDVAYVAALGHLFDYTGSRGLYKTTDGGASWTKLTNGLPDDGRTGATVVTLHPADPETVFVGFYERRRYPHTMDSGGPNGGLFKSTDGGASWRKLTAGLPTGETGQIDVDIFHADPAQMVAYVEADEALPHDLSVPGPGVYTSTDYGETWTYRFRHNSRPYYHGRIRIHPQDPDQIYVVARDFHYSVDGGATFTRGQPWRIDGGDEHDLWISPRDPDVLIAATDQGARLSRDAGATMLSLDNMAIGQYYAIGVDMRDPYWVYGGLQDNGGWATPSNSRDPRGILVDHVTVVNGGDGFHMQADPTDWRTVYTTTHVGFFGRQDMHTREHVFITPTPATITNFEAVYDPAFDETPTNYSINPEDRWLWYDIENPTVNGANLPPQFRFNWNSPLVLSPTNPRTVYVGGSHLFVSEDRGETWRIISPDLTRNDPARRNSTTSGGLTKDATGAENYHTIYTVDPSVLDPALIWVGTDDGFVQVTRDGGATWTNVTANIPGVPEGTWVSRVEASQHDAATAYVTFDGHWTGDVNPYVYKTTDYGATWTDLTATLPRALPGLSVHTIVEDPVNPTLLFLGTEFGVYATLDGGQAWHPFMNGLPPVAVHDLVIHPRDRDLVAGTHGRSIWIADDLSALQQLTPEALAAPVHVFEGRPGTHWFNYNKGRIQNYFRFSGENPPPGAPIHLHLRETPPDSLARITVADAFGGRTRTLEVPATAGLHTVRWDLTFLPTEAESEAHRAALSGMAATIRARLQTFADAAILAGMRTDLLAVQRYPSLYKDAAYPDRDDARALLLTHLTHIETALAEAETVRDFYQVREQLLAYSFVVGDAAYLGFYGRELRPTEAPPGPYRVTVEAGGHTAEGLVTVRNDPAAGDRR
ncbi:MAG: hypothetical protein AAF970_01215 [Bacteroidota bacterium]